jgi:hypothetical protein
MLPCMLRNSWDLRDGLELAKKNDRQRATLGHGRMCEKTRISDAIGVDNRMRVDQSDGNYRKEG